MTCYCGNQKSFSDCCEPLIKETQSASTAEALMRSRYSAYHLKLIDYIELTTDPQALSEIDRVSNKQWAEKAHFKKLEVLSSKEDGNKGVVEFKAYFSIEGVPEEQTHHEVSTFRKQKGRWYFRAGRIIEAPKK